MKTRTRVVLLVCAGLIVVAFVALWALRRSAPVPAADKAMQGPAVALTTVKIGTFTERIAAHGRVGPPAGSDAKLAFGGSGILTSIDVRVGDSVHAGEPLASYGGADVAAAQLASAQAHIAAAQARLVSLQRGTGSAQSDRAAAVEASRQAEAKVQLDRSALSREQTLLSAGIAARKDVEAARSQLTLDIADSQAARSRVGSAAAGVGDALTQARADYESAIGDASAARRTLQNATLRAPSDGIVMAILKHVGEAVDPSTPVIDVVPELPDSVTLTISGFDGRRVRQGNAVDFTVGLGDVHDRGFVRAVVPAVDPATQTTTVTVDGAPPTAQAGDAVDASIVVGHSRGIVIPSTAVVQDPQNGTTIVFVQAASAQNATGFEPRKVRIAASDARSALIASGLRLGERIATQGAFELLLPSG